MLKAVVSIIALAASAGGALAHPGNHEEFSLTEMLLHLAGWEHLGLSLLVGAVVALGIWTLRAMREDRRL
jgi:hydrogenase/urease accessory protein HupE